MHYGLLRPDPEIPKPPTPAELLWQYAYVVAGQREEQASWLQEEYDALTTQDTSQFNLYEKDLWAARELQYTRGSVEHETTKVHEASILELLERVETGEAQDDDIFAFLPPEFVEEHLAATAEKRKPRSRMTRVEYAGNDVYDFLFGIVSHELDRPQGRLTTGRQQTSLNAATQKLSGAESEAAFMFVTADTHGGKVRHNGKKGDRYKTKDGRRIRKI